MWHNKIKKFGDRMNKLTIKFNLYNFDNIEIRDYLLSLKEIHKMDTDDEKIIIEYLYDCK